ncbi:MAG: type IV pilin protein, partial [Gammaproteobacteria bacterium]|nr:type IV pilin protein [Gammaproteobacteria bacterium]
IGALLENSSRLEKCIANHGAYNNASCTTTTPSKRNYYAITAVLGEETYTLTATAQNAQADDAECVTLTLTNLGQKGSTGSAPVTRCWSQ